MKNQDRRTPSGTVAEALRIAGEVIDTEANWSRAFERTKHYEIAHLRFVLWAMMRRAGMTLPAIGRTFGLYCTGTQAPFDHTTVLSGLRKFERGELCIDVDIERFERAAEELRRVTIERKAQNVAALQAMAVAA